MATEPPTTADVPEDYETLVERVAEMRHAQRVYFTLRSQPGASTVQALQRAKFLEGQVDQLIYRLHRGGS